MPPPQVIRCQPLAHDDVQRTAFRYESLISERTLKDGVDVNSPGKRICLLVFAISLSFLLSGCATPTEIKTASRAQIELIGALNDATLALQEGLGQFHREQEARIREEGRILIARQAINVVAPNPDETTTADGLFKTSNEKVRLFVDYAFMEPDIEAAIKKTQDRVNHTTDPFLKGSLQSDLDDLQLLKASLSQKPKDVREIEAVIQGDIALEKETPERVIRIFRILNAQVALMKTMSTTIDDWLTLDVTITQQQADGLKKAFFDAKAALEQGAK